MILFGGGQKWSKVVKSGKYSQGSSTKGVFWRECRGYAEGSTLGLLGMILNKGGAWHLLPPTKKPTLAHITPHQPT